MRLLNAYTLQLKEFFLILSPYAALSHSWTVDEVTYEDMRNLDDRARQKEGFAKLLACARLAQDDGLEYFWIDTCCLDKTSSAELSETLNSMFNWFEGASICYVYLFDVKAKKSRLDFGFEQSKYFTRGWFLQELLAPNDLRFYNRDWTFLGTRYGLASQIAHITGIDLHILVRNHKSGHDAPETHHLDNDSCRECGNISAIKPLLKSVTIANRMLWTARRETIREEDWAYSLLGIFDVSIPLLYGEGIKAFLRLQEAIVKGSNDHSIIAFRSPTPTLDVSKDALVHGPVLSPMPAFFQDNIQPDWALPDITSNMNYLDGDLSIDMLICPPLESPFGDCFGHFIGVLDCVLGDDLLSRPAILLRKITGSQKFFRIGNSLLFQVRPEKPDVLLPIFPDNTPETIVEDYMGMLLLCLILEPKTDQVKVTFDPGDARRARVTITSPKPEIERQVWKMPPLRLKCEKSSQRSHETGYNITRTVPDRVGDYIMPLQKPSSIGLVVLESPLLTPILVAWGFSPEYPVAPWCRILPLTEVKHSRLDGIIERVRSNDPRIRPKLEPVAELKSRVDTRRCGPENTCEIASSISITTFLDRHAIQLEVEIQKLE
jgi:hypothetical protein